MFADCKYKPAELALILGGWPAATKSIFCASKFRETFSLKLYFVEAICADVAAASADRESRKVFISGAAAAADAAVADAAADVEREGAKIGQGQLYLLY